MVESASEVTDKRVQRSMAKVLSETYGLLTEGGIGGVSIDEVARRSGVSKTTIYRHWPSRSALLLDACSKLGSPAPVPDTGTLPGDLAILAAGVAEDLCTARWPAVLPSIIDAAERDPEVAGVQAALQVGFTAPFLAVAERARHRGELPDGRSASDIVASLLGPLFFRRWFSREPIDDRFVEMLVHSVTHPAGASHSRPPCAPSGKDA